MKPYKVTITEKLQMTARSKRKTAWKRSGLCMTNGTRATLFSMPSASRASISRLLCLRGNAVRGDSFLGWWNRTMLLHWISQH